MRKIEFSLKNNIDDIFHLKIRKTRLIFPTRLIKYLTITDKYTAEIVLTEDGYYMVVFHLNTSFETPGYSLKKDKEGLFIEPNIELLGILSEGYGRTHSNKKYSGDKYTFLLITNTFNNNLILSR